MASSSDSTRDQAATISSAGDPEPEAEPLDSDSDSASDHAGKARGQHQHHQRRRAKYVLSEKRRETIDSLIHMMMGSARDSEGKRVHMQDLVRKGGPKSFFKHECFFKILWELTWREVFVIDRHEALRRIRAMSEHHAMLCPTRKSIRAMQSDLDLTSEKMEHILPTIVNMAIRLQIQSWFHKIRRNRQLSPWLYHRLS